MQEVSRTRTRKLAILIVAAVCVAACDRMPGEIDGTIKYDDCRSTVTIGADSFRAASKQFVCSFRKSQSGRIMSGTCVNTEITSTGACERAYVYEKRLPAGTCSKETPWYGYDDRCYADFDAGREYAGPQ